MNKKLIALAVGAALAAPLVAQADVTVYGRAQLELANQKTQGTNTTKDVTTRNLVDNKMGRIGVHATEDLGDGMTGIAHFGFIVDTAGQSGGITTSRQSYVGLKGGFGAVHFGRNAGAYKGTNLDPFIATTLEARAYGGESRGNFGHNGFINDSIKYINKFGQVKFVALMTAGNSNSNVGTNGAGDNGDFQLAVDYKGGPLRVIVAYSKNKDAVGTATAGNLDAEKRTKLAGQYAVGPGKVTLSYESVKNYSSANLGGLPKAAGAAMVTNTTVGGMANNVGDVTFTMLAYGMKLPNRNSLYLRYGQEKYKDQVNQKVKSYAVAIKHSMSKTFRVWAGYDQSKFDGGSKYSTLSVGMRKDF